MGNATVRISRLSRSANNASAKSLDPLHDYLGMMPAVRKAVADRAETLLTLQTHLADVDEKARIAKLEMDFSKMHKAEMLGRELAADEAAAEAARTEYLHIQGRHQGDFKQPRRAGAESSRLCGWRLPSHAGEARGEGAAGVAGRRGGHGRGPERVGRHVHRV